MKKLVIGILAHVDAGKTTLAESLLYLSGKIQKAGRVDQRNAYLDTHFLEKERGITIFSQQAVFKVGEVQITLLDTPGHVDFSAEMERTLRILDYAILVISGADGVQGHTKTLWSLLEAYEIPVFIFVNKMDQPAAHGPALLQELKEQLAEGCLQFSTKPSTRFYEELAFQSEELLETYLSRGKIGNKAIRAAVLERKVFPTYLGSALKIEGVQAFLKSMLKYAAVPAYPRRFGARIFKISRDEEGNRLTHLKLLGGNLRVKDLLTHPAWEDKIHEIRIYSGETFQTAMEVEAGTVCAVTGLSRSRPGQGLGIGGDFKPALIEPVLSYRILLPPESDPREILPKLRQIEDEEPELRLVWDEDSEEIRAEIMGEIQIEILQSLIENRFGIKVQFGAGRILYQETIAGPVEGVGHFGPPRHYAEVHLLLEPGRRGSGLRFTADCSEDVLARNWQEQILSCLKEKKHRGVLTGAPLADLKITLLAGLVDNITTQGGDLQEAACRAVRQGLKEAESILLEPYYRFQLEIPEKMVGRALADLEQRQAAYQITGVNRGLTLLQGTAPAVFLRNYHRRVLAYTQGAGRLFCSLDGYKPCQRAAEVIRAAGYDAERDLENPAGSIFSRQGRSFFVPWDQVKKHRHLGSRLEKPKSRSAIYRTSIPPAQKGGGGYQFLARTAGANRGKKRSWKKKKGGEESGPYPALERAREKYLLVDAYNIIHAWSGLKKFALENMDLARMKLLDTLASYQAVRNWRIIVVFDAHLVPGRLEETFDYHNLRVVFTKEAQSADEYIEKFAYEHKQKYEITVATSDGLQQIITRGAGSALMSAADLREEVERAVQEGKRFNYRGEAPVSSPLDQALPAEVSKRMEDLKKKP